MKHFFFSSILLLMTTVSFSQCTVTGGTIAASQTICNGGDPAAFTESLGSTGSGTLTYTWKHSTDNYAATLGTFSTYDVPSGLTAFTTYRRITTNTIGNLTCTATSNDLIVSIGVTAATIASPQTICNGGDPAAFTVPVASTGFGTLSYDWKHSTDNYAATLGTSSTYDVPSGLTASTTYRIITTGTVGSLTCTANSNDIGVTVNQGAPAAPIATAASNFTCTSMNANWGAVSGATQYFLDLATDAAFTTFVIGYNDVNVGNVTTYNVAGLTANTTYHYRVRADNGCSISLNSNAIITAGGGANAPIAAAASGLTCTSMNANWGAALGAIAYRLDVSTDSTFSTFLPGLSNLSVGNVNAYNVSGLTVNTTYYYRVRADNACSTSLNSNTITVVLSGVTGGTIASSQTICNGGDPAAFTESIASTGSGTLSYQWKQSSDGYSAVLATTATYDIPFGLTATTSYRRITTSTASGVSCSANSNDIIVTVNILTGGTIASSQTICNGCDPAAFTESASSIGSGTLSYAWKQSTDSYAATLATTTTYDVSAGLTSTTTYRRITTSTLGGVACSLNSNDIVITILPVGIQEANIFSGITIAPNPFTSQTTISFTTEVKNATVKIIDIVGKEVKNITFSGSQLLIEKGELNAGIYFVQVVSEKKIIANKKIVIE